MGLVRVQSQTTFRGEGCLWVTRNQEMVISYGFTSTCLHLKTVLWHDICGLFIIMESSYTLELMNSQLLTWIVWGQTCFRPEKRPLYLTWIDPIQTWAHLRIPQPTLIKCSWWSWQDDKRCNIELNLNDLKWVQSGMNDSEVGAVLTSSTADLTWTVHHNSPCLYEVFPIALY